MYTNPFNRKHSTIRQVLDRLLDPTRKPIRRSESVSSSDSNTSKSSSRSWNGSNHSHRGILQWGRNDDDDDDDDGGIKDEKWAILILTFSNNI
ncbi:hypothetical protein M0802_009891 [Mischocyttarus mexicanus]|nr:hypothetical protein M0802_009891 [Mischocyttarus mexicanus]